MMKGFFSRLFGPKNAAPASSPEDEIAAAIAMALELYRNERTTRTFASGAVRRNGPASAWSCKSYGMTPLPQRNRRW